MFVFEWDEDKEKSNIRKHKVSFAEGESVFDDRFLITFPDELHSFEEERFISIGYSNVNRLLLIVHKGSYRKGRCDFNQNYQLPTCDCFRKRNL